MKPICSPAFTVAASADLVTVTFGQFTTTEVLSLLSLVSTSPGEVMETRFSSGVEHIVGLDTALRVIVRVFPGTRPFQVHVMDDPLGIGPGGTQAVASGPPTVQLRPTPGIVSFRTTFCGPVPPAVTVRV